MGTSHRSDRRISWITLISLFIVIFIFDQISAAPLQVNSQVCRGGCPTSNKGSRLQFAPGQVYVYDVNSVVLVSLQGDNPQETKLEIKGEVHLNGLSADCHYGIHLEKVELFGTDNKRIQLNNVLPLDKVVRFTLANDRLEPEICSDESDVPFSLNIKRSIISLLQADAEKSSENDVYGSCPTSVNVQKADDGSYKISKQRDLTLCSHRETLSSSFVQGIFNENSGVKSTALLRSEYLNDQHITAQGVLDSATVSEQYDFAPLSSKGKAAGASASINTNLKLKTQHAGGAPKLPSPTQSQTLPLRFENPVAPLTAKADVIKEVVINLRTTLTNNIGAETAEHFVELIRLLRQTPHDVLSSVYQQIKSKAFPDKNTASNIDLHKIFLDALFRAGTSDSVELIASLLKTKSLDADAKSLAFLSFNLANDVNPATIPLVADIVKEKDAVPRESYLNVGNLLRKYCQRHSCAGNEIQPVLNNLQSKINCNAKKNELPIFLLKALRNTNHLDGSALDKVITCTGKTSTTRVRVNAIQALAAAQCNPKAHATALKLLKDHEEDSEIRIEAYLVLAGCPSEQVANELQAVLNDEPSNQVGSFIASHLNTLRYSTDVTREEARAYLSKIRLSKKYPSDIRKYSFNYEASHELGSAGLGASVDASVIYSPKSFLPRSARLNLTGELFGSSFNVLELNTRQENLEAILEHYFGPKGVVTTAKPQQAADWTVQRLKLREHNRKRRGIRDDVQHLGSAPHSTPDHNSLDLSVKLFGSELFFLNAADTPFDKLDRKIQDKLKSVSINKHALFLDGDLVYPTAIGFPLRIQAQGAASINLKFEYASTTEQGHSITLIPSYNLLLSGGLNVDGYAVNTGLKISGSVHSSTGSKISVKTTDRKRFELDVQFPSKKQEILSFEHKVVFITQEKGEQTVERSVNPQGKKQVSKDNCFDQVSPFIGATVCLKGTIVEFTAPGAAANKKVSPSWLLNGPNTGAIWVEVESQYKFVAEYENKNNESRTLTLEFIIPGGASERKTSIVLKAETAPQKFVLAKLELPGNQVYAAEVGITNSNSELSIYSKLTNARDVYEDRIGFKKSGPESRQEYTPIIVGTGPQKKDNNYEVSGKIIVDKTQSPKVTYNFEKLKLDSKQPSKYLPLGIDGTLTHKDTSELTTNLQLSYKDKWVKPVIDLKLGKNSVDLKSEITNNFNEKLAGKLDLKHERSDKKLHNHLLVIFGSDLQSSTNRLEYDQNLQLEHKDKKIVGFDSKNTLNIPYLPLNLKLDAQHSDKISGYNVEVKYNRNSLSSRFHLKRNQKANGDWDLLFNAAANAHNLKVVSTRDIDSKENKSHLKNKLTTSEGTEIEVNSDFSNVLDKDHADVKANGRLVLLAQKEPYNIEFVLLVTPTNGKSNAKISAGSGELASYDLNVNRNGGDQNAKADATLNLKIKDLLSGDGKYEHSKGKGSSDLLITLLKSGRKLNLKQNYEKQPTELKINTELFYDFEKDNSKKITLNTDTKFPKNSLGSKNDLIINGDKYGLDVNADHSKDASQGTKSSANFALRLPSQREISGEVNRDSNARDGKHSCNSKVRLSDTLAGAAGKKSRTLLITSSVTDGSLDPLLFNVHLTTKYSDFDNKDLSFDAKFKHLPKGHFKTAVAELKLSGTQVPNEVDVVLNIEEYCPIHAVYKTSLRYGNQADISINGKYKYGERGVEPSTYEINASAQIPESKLRSVSITSNGNLKLPKLEDENGATEVELNLSGNVNEKKLSFKTNGKASKRDGNLHIEANLPDADPFTLGLTYAYSQTSTDSIPPTKTHDARGTVDVRYGGGKTVAFSGEAKVVEDKEFDVHGKLQTSYEQARNLDLRLRGTKKGGNTYSNEAILNVDKKEYKLNTFVTASSKAPSVDLNVYYPESKHSQVKASLIQRSDNEYEAELNLLNVNEVNVAAKGVGHFKNVDSFGLLLDLDAPKLNISKFHLDVKTKPQGGSKGISFDAKSENKNVLNGEASYSVKEENGKTIVSGEGSLKWYDKPVQANFKLSRNVLDGERDREIGVQYSFSGDFNAKNILAELKLTNKNFVLKNTVCEKSKTGGCVNIEVNSNLRRADLNSIYHGLIVVVDLRPLGFQHEFKLSADTELVGWVLNHNLEITLQAQNKANYQYKVYVQPSKSGVTLIIPSRTVAVEAVYVIPNEFVGKYEASLTAYLDKERNPGKKATVGFSGEVQQQGKSIYKTLGALKINHPSVKELSISGKSELNTDSQLITSTLTIDIFKNTNQQIVIESRLGNTDHTGRGYNITSEISVVSRGLGIDYGASGHAAANLDRRLLTASSRVHGPTQNENFLSFVSLSQQNAQALINVLGEEVLNAQANLDYQRKEAKLHTQAKILGIEPVVTDLTLVGFTQLKGSVVRGVLLNINGEINTKEATLNVVGDGKTLLTSRVAFDSTLHSEYNLHDQDLKAYLKTVQNTVKQDSQRSRDEISRRFENVKNTISKQINNVKDNLPDLQNVNAEYKQELEKFGDELLADKNIKEFADFFKKIHQTVGKTIGDILRILVDNFKKIGDTINNFFKQIYEILNEKILPTIKNSLNKIADIFQALFEETLNLAVDSLKQALKTLKQFEGDFAKVSKVITDNLKSVGQVLSKHIEAIRKEIDDIYKLVIEHIKSWPGLEQLKQKIEVLLNELDITDKLLAVLKDINTNLKQYIPVKNFNEFLDNVNSYLEKKLKRTPNVDDVEELKKITGSLFRALKEVLEQNKSLFTFDKDTLTNWLWIPTGGARIPGFYGLKSSIWNYAENEKLPTVTDLIRTYRPHAFNPLNILPPFIKEGHIVNGETVLTFDGRHLSVPGNCKYLIAQDAVNNNFSIVANIADGKLKSIALLDKSGVSVEVLESGVVNVNEAASELPVHDKDIHAWRDYYTVNLLSRYGVEIQCKLGLKVCHIAVSGFYHNKLRGLFGNANYEPFDDYHLPDGKLAQSASDFGNSFKLQASCPAAAITDEQDHAKHDAKSKECENLLGSNSRLRLCHYFIDPTPYLEACQHAVSKASNKEEAACNIALGYASYCRYENVLAYAPKECGKCNVVDSSGQPKTYALHEKYEVTSPQKQADVVLVVDTKLGKPLEEIVQNLIKGIREELKSQGISDIHTSVIGYKKGERFLNHYTSKGQLDIDGNWHLAQTKSEKEDIVEDSNVKTGIKKVDDLVNSSYDTYKTIQEELGLSADGRAFREALNYPFRSGASKAIVAIRSDQLTKSLNPLKTVGASVAGSISNKLGVTTHLLGPIPNLAFDNQKDASSVVGFNSKTVVQSGDVKKRGSTELRPHLSYGSDLGIDVVQASDKGFAFSLTNYNNLKSPAEKKQFLDVASYAIATQVARTQIHNECTCILHNGIYPKEICWALDSKVLAPIHKKN